MNQNGHLARYLDCSLSAELLEFHRCFIKHSKQQFNEHEHECPD